MKCNAELNTRQKTVMTHLLVCRTVKEAAQKAGVRLATVFKWLKDPTFKAELNRLREEVIADVADREMIVLESKLLGGDGLLHQLPNL